MRGGVESAIPAGPAFPPRAVLNWIDHSGAKAAGEPWATSATFLYDDQGTRYAVEVRVSHRKVAGKRAFFGFDVVRVAKQ